ncbi:MAG: molybdopterin-dependent oxidoreductase [Burkholderiaceae bacterium]
METRSTCCYCGVGCGVVITSNVMPDGSQAISDVRGDPDHPANWGRLCSKGSTLALTSTPAIARQLRIGAPEIRRSRDAPREEVSWDHALTLACDRFADIILRHGPNAVGFYISGQLLTEDYYLFNKLAKGLIGTNNIDTNSRLCMSSAVAGYKRSLGADSVPCCYEDLDHAATVFIVGANPAYAHPILYQRLRQARLDKPDLRVIVADPRRTDTAEEADLFLQIRPGSDVWLFHGMLKFLIAEGRVDSDFVARSTVGFTQVVELLGRLSLEQCSVGCGVSLEDLQKAARAFANGPTLSLWCQGLNQSASGTDKNTALINLHLATGQIGKPGAGPFSLTGQPNAMGGREVGGMANLLPAHRDLGNASDRAEIARFWGVPSLPVQTGQTAVEMFKALERGEIRAIWIACTNPAHSMPDQRAIRRALDQAEFVVLQEAFRNSATVPYADVLLPATSWGEKDGTVTNSERTISRVRPAQAGYGSARHDWEIGLDFARRLEARLRPGQPSLFPYTSAQSIWNEHRTTTRGRDLDITGLSYAILETRGPQQWPYPEGALHGTKRLYADGRFATPDRRARFTAPEPVAPADPTGPRYPTALTSGRLRDQWHGMSRTGTIARAFAHVPTPAVELSPEHMASLNVAEGDLVHVTGRLASQVLPAQQAKSVGFGQAFIAMHWNCAYVSGRTSHSRAHGVNDLFPAAIDPISKQPELKHAAVRILKAEFPWDWIAAAWLPADEALRAQRILSEQFGKFAYAHCVPFGRERIGLEWRAADDFAPTREQIRAVEAVLGLGGGGGILSYLDARRAQSRCIRVADDRIVGFSLAGDVRSAGWLRQYLEDEQPVFASKRRLLAPHRNAPGATKARSRILCNCAGVDVVRITTHIAESLHLAQNPSLAPDRPAQDLALDSAKSRLPEDAEILESLKTDLRCGAQCGSCVPELRRMVREARPL